MRSAPRWVPISRSLKRFTSTIARRPEPFSQLFVTFFARNAILETAMVMPRISPVSRANAPGAVKRVIVATHTNRFIHNRLSQRLIVQESPLSDFGQRAHQFRAGAHLRDYGFAISVVR
jgi:hypothetical protein